VEKMKRVTPGEKLAVIEEFSPSKGTYMNRDSIRALKLGVANYDLKKKEIRMEPLKKIGLPMMGDRVIGQVDAVQSNIANIKIYYVNNERSFGGFAGMLILKPESSFRRGRGKAIICKLGDIVRAKVKSYRNAIVHLSIDDDENGVIYTKCSSCGGDVDRIDQRIKCVDCGLMEERKLAFDFGKAQLK
jgi:exosome complex component CSL4